MSISFNCFVVLFLKKKDIPEGGTSMTRCIFFIERYRSLALYINQKTPNCEASQTIQPTKFFTGVRGVVEQIQMLASLKLSTEVHPGRKVHFQIYEKQIKKHYYFFFDRKRVFIYTKFFLKKYQRKGYVFYALIFFHPHKFFLRDISKERLRILRFKMLNKFFSKKFQRKGYVFHALTY